jgi:hypothetical protein
VRSPVAFRSRSRLESSLTLMDVYGAGHVYNPIAPERGDDWIRSDPNNVGLGVARRLPIAGALPILCTPAAASTRGFELLEAAGLRRPEHLVLVDSPESQRAALKKLACTHPRVALQHAYPVDELPQTAWWIPPELLSFLNNKANLTKLVPDGHTPRREVVPIADLSPEHPAIRHYPVFVKVATDLSTGGGTAVRRCRTPVELVAVRAEFANQPSVVVEEEFEFDRSFCVQFAIAHDASVRYLGAAEQIVNERCGYSGSWFDLRAEADAGFMDIGTAISEVGGAMGYYGIAGYDMARRTDGTVIVFDLNFRINGSTTPLLLSQSVLDAHHRPVMRSGRWQGSGSFEDLRETTLRASNEGWLTPYATVEPQDASNPDAHPLLGALIAGTSREDVDARDAQFRAMLGSRARGA